MSKIYRNIAFAALFVLAGAVSATLVPRQAEGQDTEGKYGKHIFTDIKPMDIPADVLAKIKAEQKKQQSMVDSFYLVNLDKSRMDGAPYLDFHWMFKGQAKGYAEQEHTHDFDEFLGFVGIKGQKDPHNLGAELELWLGGEKYAITKSCLIHVPAGVRHCPLRFTRIDMPILFFTGAMQTGYSRTATEFKKDKAAERNFAKYISYDVNPEKVSAKTLNMWKEINKKNNSTIESARLMDMDKIEGAPYIDFVWLWKGTENGANHQAHSHEWGEAFGFIGSKVPENPRALGGEIEFWINGEKHLLHKSCLIWIPGGLQHCPMTFNRVDSPILVFTVGMTKKYSVLQKSPVKQ